MTEAGTSHGGCILRCFKIDHGDGAAEVVRNGGGLINRDGLVKEELFKPAFSFLRQAFVFIEFRGVNAAQAQMAAIGKFDGITVDNADNG